MRLALNQKQRQAFDFIKGRLDNGEQPTFDQIREALGFISKSSAIRLTQSLLQKGWLVRLNGKPGFHIADDGIDVLAAEIIEHLELESGGEINFRTSAIKRLAAFLRTKI